MTKTSRMESTRVTNEREPVLYVFRNDAAPWLLVSTFLRYEGLAQEMRPSKAENFEILIKTLRARAPTAQYEARLLAIRAAPTLLTAGAKRLSASSAGTLDVLAHIVAMAIGKTSRPYR